MEISPYVLFLRVGAFILCMDCNLTIIINLINKTGITIMRIEESRIGCSVRALHDLDDAYIRLAYENYYDPYWDGDTNKKKGLLKPQNVYTKQGLKKLIKALKDEHSGICVFSDNLEYGNGEKLAVYLRKNGYRVEDSGKYINKNHDSKCKMWTFFYNERPKVGKGKNVAKRSGSGNGRKAVAAEKSSVGDRLAARLRQPPQIGGV